MSLTSFKLYQLHLLTVVVFFFIHFEQVTETRMPPKLLWTDEGTGGRAGSLWTINRLGLFCATVGHKAPSGPFYDFKAKIFTVVDDGTTSTFDATNETKETKQDTNPSKMTNPLMLRGRHERTASSETRRLQMLTLMRRKSLHAGDVDLLKHLMEEEKNAETGDHDVPNPLSLLGSDD